jgi:DNA adenine methylase
LLTCQFCGNTDNEDFQFDKYNQGFWCEVCDGFTYFDHIKNRHRFVLILEKSNINQPKVKAPIRFNKRLSPFRYPGGKSKIIDYLYLHLKDSKTKKLVSPFTGGGSFELAMLDAGVIEYLHLNDLDTGIFSFWWVVKHMPFALIERLKTITPTHDDFFQAQEIIKNDYANVDVVDAAWAVLIVNRLAYSGIAKANPLGGRNGSHKKLLSRWNPKELIKRIKKIHSMGDQIEVTQMDAFELIEDAYWDNQATLFIDPPYVGKGRDLYHCYYTEKDHIELSHLLHSLYQGFPGADLIVTYDYHKLIDDLYYYPQREVINRTYSA